MMGSNSGFPDLLTVLVNIGAVIPPIIMMMQWIAVLIGFWLVASSLVEFWGVSNDNAMKYVAGFRKFSVGSGLIRMFVGAIFLTMGTLEWLGIMSRTLTGDYANSRMLSYSQNGTTLQAQAMLATMAMLGIMQVVGFIAMCKGLMTINKHFSGQDHAGLGTASGWMIGGVLAWNFKWVSDVLNNTIGFSLIGMFSAHI